MAGLVGAQVAFRDELGIEIMNGGMASIGHVGENSALLEEVARDGNMHMPIFSSKVEMNTFKEQHKNTSWEMLSLEEAFVALEHRGDQPSIDNFICILEKCRERKSLLHAKLVHTHICGSGLETHRALGNYLVPLFVKCGSVFLAQQAFHNLISRNEHSWTSLIQGYIEHGEPLRALELFQKMQEDCLDPNMYTLMVLLKACAKLKCVGKGQEIHCEVVKEEFERDTFISNTLVDMYAKCGSPAEARAVFDKMPVRDVVSWNALLGGYANLEEALSCLEDMRREGVSPNAVTLVCSLKACGSIGDINKGQELHAEVLQKGFEKDAFVSSVVIDMYSKCGSFVEAQYSFDKLPIHDEVSWTSLIAGYAEHGLNEEALKCLQKMQLEGIPPDALAYACGLKACVNGESIDKGWELHTEIIKEEFESDLSIGSTLVDMYAKCGLLAEAREVFDVLPLQDVVSWTALISGYAEHGLGEEALNCVDQMQRDGISLNAVTYVCSLKACGSIGAIGRGRDLDVEISRKGLKKDLFVANSLLDMYAKCGSLTEAQEIFDELLARNVISWNALMSGYAEQGLGEETLDCLQQMQSEGMVPTAVTFTCSLKACCTLRDLERGQELHAETAKEEFESDPFIGNTLVDMYAKCGFFAEAQAVFEELPVQDVVSWTALISGYAAHGLGEEALTSLEQMQLEGVSPSETTLVCSLRACKHLGAVDKGREIHAMIANEGFERNTFLSNTLVDVYANFGLLLEAQDVFDELLVRDVVSWNALSAGYAERGLEEEVFNCLQQMQLEGVSPDAVTFVCCLIACSSMKTIDVCQILHAEILKEGFEGFFFVGNMLVDTYAQCNLLGEAQEVFNHLPVRDVVSWNALIAGNAISGHWEQVMHSLEQMQLEGISPNAVTFGCSLNACGNIGSGRRIHSDIVKVGFESFSSVGSNLVDMYAKCGSLAEAKEVFDKVTGQDIALWNTFIAGCLEHKLGEEVLNCVESMQLEGVSPNAGTFMCILKACGNLGAVDMGRFTHSEIVKGGFERDHFVGTTLVYMYAKSGDFLEAWKLFDQLPVQDVVSWNTLIAGYCDCELAQEAQLCLDKMQIEGVIPDIISWNTLLLGFAEQGERMAFVLYGQMQEQGLLPNITTFISVLKLCGSSNTLAHGQQVHAQISTFGEAEVRETNMTSTLIDMYCKCGSTDNAQQVFDALYKKDIVSWTTLISGYARVGESELVFSSFERMIKEGIQPDGITFLSVLTACSHAGLLNKGQKYLESMSKEYGITPTIKHYNCMIDLFCRAGLLKDAKEMVEKLPFQPDLVTWRTILGACRKWANVELGRQAFEYAVRLNEKHTAVLILMSNIYADAHMWEDVKKIEVMRANIRAWKDPEKSSIEIDGFVHTFAMRNMTFSQRKSLLERLKLISAKAEEKGIPISNPVLQHITDSIVEDDNGSCGHNEKIAIACGLMNTLEGSPLRVVKNLRVCDGCHMVIALICKVEQRIIICRDSVRFHLFKDGKCSCGDG